MLARADGRGQPRGPAGVVDRARRHRRRERARVRGIRGGVGRPSVRRCRSAIPFEEKRLIEACLELLDARPRGRRAGPRRAAGLSCAASETAAKAGAGMDRRRRPRAPKREPGMNAVEVLTSESQERMLAIVEPRHLDEVLELCAAVGDPRDGRRTRHRHRPLPRLRRPLRRASASPARTRHRRAATPSPWCRRTRRRSPTSRATASATARRTTGRWRRPADHEDAPRRRPGAGSCRRASRRHRPRSTSCSRCSPRRRSPTSRGSGTSTTTSCS